MTRTILLVEDNPHIMKINSDTLTEAGYRVLEATTAARARVLFEREAPDLIVLDIMLPDGDGLELCRSIRGDSDVPILFLSARRKNVEIVAGLRAGGDDYLPKPYDLGVLLARIEALLRRAAAAKAAESPPLKFGALEICVTPRRALLHGIDLLLEPKEFALLEILAENRDRYTSADELYRRVWGMQAAGDTRTVKVRISCIRRKLGDEFDIRTEWGKGYRLVVRS